MKDSETIRRGLLRRLGYPKTISSLPLISGDTYKSLSDRWVSTENLGHLFVEQCNCDKQGLKLFMDGPTSHLLASILIAGEGRHKCNHTIIIHNSDEIPNEFEMQVISKSFKKIYSVNWLGDNKICTPVPIGLENISYLRNGVPNDYIKNSKRSSKSSFADRKIKLLCNFSLSTNSVERNRAYTFFKENQEGVYFSNLTSPKKYRNILLNTQFVISPPGNGPDCHRTWESIYSGAVPIVLKQFWPFKNDDLPVLQVGDWSEVNSLIENFSLPSATPISLLKKLYIDYLLD